jgi:hypothetical protein
MWDDQLHFLAFAFNSACHESTKMCPSKLFLGRELNTPLENVWNLTEVYVFSEEERTKFWTEAIRNLTMAKNRVASRFNRGRKEAHYKVGDLVLCQRKVLRSKGKGISQKLELRWSVPMKTQRFLKPTVVQLASPKSGVIIRKAHLSQLKPYHTERGDGTK